MILDKKHEMQRKLFRQFAETEFTKEIQDELDETVVVGNVDDAGLTGEGVHKQSADLLGLHALDDQLVK